MAAEYPGVALRVHLRGGEHDPAAGPGDRFDQRVVLGRGRRLRELDVVGDRPGAVAAEAVDHLAVQVAGEGPALPQLAERPGVDLHDRQVVGHRLGPADREAGVDGAQLLAVQEVGPICDQGDRRGAEGHRHQADRAAAAQALCPHQRLARYCCPECRTTLRCRAKSRTTTVCCFDLKRVPAQESSVNQMVPRTVAEP